MKKWTLLILALVMAFGGAALAEDLDSPQLKNPLAALKVSLPDAQVDYAVREYDDGRYEWKLFFEQNGSLGMCKILEKENTIKKVELYDKPEGALNAMQAMAKLAEEKGSLNVVELDLDRDDGMLCYEGEAELGGRRYEFEMTVDGRIIEWERD